MPKVIALTVMPARSKLAFPRHHRAEAKLTKYLRSLHVLPTANASLHRTSDSDSTTATPSSVVSKTAPTLPCKFFNSQGGCQNGDSCSFLHTFVIPPGAQPVARPRPWRTRPCRHYQLAKCNLGDACHFAHVADPHFPLPPGYERTLNMTGELCYEGVCSRGQLCRFVHYRPPVQKEPGAEDHSLTEGRVEALRQLVKTASHSDDDSEEGEDEDEDEDEIQIVSLCVQPNLGAKLIIPGHG